MKITCDHCGSIVDTKLEKKCSNCGAPYTNNKEYKEMLRQERVRKEQFEQTATKVMNNVSSNMVVGKIIAIFVVIFTIIIITFTFLFIFNVDSQINEMTSYDKNEDSIKNEVSFNENSIGSDYEIKCDKISIFKNEKELFNKKDGFNYYNFHIVFNNKANISLLSEITLTYTDSDGNEDVVSSRELADMNKENLDIIATKKGTYTGNVIFGVPSYVKDIKINYKDSIIKINNFKDKIE